MAARKPAETKTEEKTQETLEKTEDQVQEDDVQEAPAARAKGPDGQMVKVKNNGRFFFRQPSTGIRIDGGGGVEELKHDRWLQLQLNSGLMELV